uniref:Methionine--tRNA ligase, cytoplasmic n=1 Tax=Rhipicephalus zambeziensis TaxID=60191 RepID=A0A224YV86_9ACAR
MKLHDCNHNFYGIKTAIFVELTGEPVPTVTASIKEKVAPYLSRPKLPVLRLEDGTTLFNANAICRFLWEKSGKNAVLIEDEEWCEWEAVKLQPAVAAALLEHIQHGKVDNDIQVALKALLRHLDCLISQHSTLSKNAQGIGFADVVVWSSILPLRTVDSLFTGLVVPFKALCKWFSHLEENESLQKALKLVLPKDGCKEFKESLSAFAPQYSPTVTPKAADTVPLRPSLSCTQASVEEKEHTLSAEEIDKAFQIWTDSQNKATELKKRTAPILPKKGEKNILITSALPYVNNVPHLGNIVGSVLSADVFARYCRIRDWNTLYVCGTDEYGTATETKALELGITPREICDRFNKIHSDIYRWFNISFDHFGRTTTEQQTKIAQEIFLELHKNGYLREEVVEQLYCSHCDRFLADRFVEGTCPFCGYEDARGDQCDLCSKLINPTELKEARCKLCKEHPVLKTSGHLFIDLPKIEPAFIEWFKKKTSEDQWTQTAKVIASAWLRDGLKPRCITRDLKWGTPVPLQNYKDKVFYVWFDAPIGYLSITANYTSDWELWWKQPDQVKLYQFMAKDNVPFHAIVFPMTQLGTHQSYTSVDHLMAVEYLNYEDAKFSKSRGVGVFGNDAQDTGIPADVWRFYLMYQRPENQDTSFCWSDLQLKNNSELLNNLGNFVNRALTFLFNNFGGVVPELNILEEDKVVIAKLSAQLGHYINFMDKVRLRDSIRCILSISRIGNQYIQFHKPWELVKGTPEQKLRSASIMALCANVACLLAGLLHPFMPETSEALRQQLNVPMLKLEAQFAPLLKAGHKMNKPLPLFKKIEQETIDTLKKRFEGKTPSPAKVVNGHKDTTVNSVNNHASGDTSSNAEELTHQVQVQGNKVRELKAAKADKAAIDKEVARLLDLKKQLAAALGEELPPPSNQKRGGQKKKK